LKKLYDILFLIKIQGVRQEAGYDLHVSYCRGKVQFTLSNHDSLIALKNSIVFANGGVIDISNILNHNLLYNLIPFGYGYHIHLISKFLVVDGAQ
jgi:hypothetical protein